TTRGIALRIKRPSRTWSQHIAMRVARLVSSGMDLGLSGRTALVTGASKGIGLGIARALAAEGAKVAVSSRSRERIDAAARAIGVRGYVHDSGDPDSAPALVEAAENDIGPIDILVTNTGGPPPGADPLGFTREQWEAAYRTLVLSPMALVARVMPGMRQRRFGRVLGVSSSAAREPIPVLMLSNAHRSGLLAAFKTLAREVAADGVTVNSVLPGRIATDRIVETSGSLEAAQRWAQEQVPARRLGTVEEFGAVATFLCSEPAGYVTGATLLVDGGLTQSI
ncbi:MAG: SDR family oxidoreductase, partial [Gammaproteobacteria bacterium]